MKLVIEMFDFNRKGYGFIHKAGCRDVFDGMPIGEAETMADVHDLANEATGWEYEPGEYRCSPCVKLPK